MKTEGITYEEISPQEAFLVREFRRRKRRRKNNCLYGAERQCGEFCDGAYCLPEYRGKNIFQNLLNYVILILSHEGSLYLGVDYESMNPTAYYFWRKYFKPYTCSVTRRIDGGEDRC